MHEKAWDQPWNKYYNDQPWKREYLHLQHEIVKEKNFIGELNQKIRKGDKNPELKESLSLSSSKLLRLQSQMNKKVIKV